MTLVQNLHLWLIIIPSTELTSLGHPWLAKLSLLRSAIMASLTLTIDSSIHDNRTTFLARDHGLIFPRFGLRRMLRLTTHHRSANSEKLQAVNSVILSKSFRWT